MQNQQLTVMHIIGNLDIGGAQEVVRTLAQELAGCDCRVVVCTLKDGPVRREIESLGIPVEVVPGRHYSIVAFPHFISDMLRIRKSLADIIDKHGIDIIQTHLLRSLDFLVLTLRRPGKTPRIFWTVHNSSFALRPEQLPAYPWLLGPKRLAHRLLYRWTARWADGLIAVSDEVKTAIVRTIGPIGDKVTVICNGVDVARYRQPIDRADIRRRIGLAEDSRLIAVVGTLKEQKGHCYLIEAARPIIAQHPDVHILFIGDGELRAVLQDQGRAAGLNGHLHFLGNRSDVPALLAACDYFVLPSLWEGLPMALIEAMASGLPIVATEVSGTKQVMIAEQTGTLVLPGNVQQLQAALEGLLADPARAEAMGAAARRRVEAAFSARKQAEEHLALYRRACNKLNQQWNNSLA